MRKSRPSPAAVLAREASFCAAGVLVGEASFCEGNAAGALFRRFVAGANAWAGFLTA
jgi:hypothetical protein